eukprot:gene25149-31571_t
MRALPIAFIGLSVNILSGLLLAFNFCDSKHPEEEDGVQMTATERAVMDHGHSHGHNVESYEYDSHDEEEEGHGGHDHGHGHGHDETFEIQTPQGILVLSIFEEGCLPEFRLHFKNWRVNRYPAPKDISVQTLREDVGEQVFHFTSLSESPLAYRSVDNIPEPHEFKVIVRVKDSLTAQTSEYALEFKESVEEGHDDHAGHDHGHAHHEEHSGHDHGHEHASAGHSHADHDHHSTGHHDHGHEHSPSGYQHAGEDHDHLSHHASSLNRIEEGRGAAAKTSLITSSPKKYEMDNNYRAAIMHVVADAFVSVLVIIALLVVGWYPSMHFLDPLVGMIGSLVILSWGYILISDTSSNLLDMNPDVKMTGALKRMLEKDGTTKVTDLHIWRLGPGHLGAILSLHTKKKERDVTFYKNKIRGFKALSHVTIEIEHE